MKIRWNSIGNCCKLLQAIQRQCKELAAALGFDKNSCPMNRISKVGRSGIDQEIRGWFLEKSMLLPTWVVFCSVSWKSELGNRSNHQRAVLRFSWSEGVLPECGGEVIFLLKPHREGPERLTTNFLRQASQHCQVFLRFQSSFVLHEIKNSTVVPIY